MCSKTPQDKIPYNNYNVIEFCISKKILICKLEGVEENKQ